MKEIKQIKVFILLMQIQKRFTITECVIYSIRKGKFVFYKRINRIRNEL